MKRIILLSGLIVFILSCNSVEIQPTESIPVTNSDKDSLSLSFMLFHNIVNESIEIPTDLILENVDNKEIAFIDLVDDQVKVILMISELGCSLCSFQQIDLLSQRFNKDLVDRVIVIANYFDKRSLKIYWVAKDIDIPLYFIENDKKILPFQSTNEPFYFMVTKEFKTNLFFAPNKAYTTLSKLYLNRVYDIVIENS